MRACFDSPWIRGLVVVFAASAAIASSGRQKKSKAPPQGAQASGPPAPMEMSADGALGLWRSSFGPVKIVRNDAGGEGSVMGVWRYMRGSEEVIGYFQGSLDGNVLQFTWHEPSQPAPLTGSGYLVFEPAGDRFSGKWWTTSEDRHGDWNGWRPQEVRRPPEDRGGHDEAGGGEQPYEDGGYDEPYDDGYGDDPYAGPRS